jgi:hypothetical protein
MHDDYASTGLLAFIPYLRFEHTPAGIQYGLCHPCLHQFEAAHIAYEYPLILIHDPSREFVQSVFASSRGASVQAFGLAFMPTTLRLGNALLDAAVKMRCLELLTLARGRGVFQAQIYSYGLLGGYRVMSLASHR